MLTDEQWSALGFLASSDEDFKLGPLSQVRFFSGDLYVPAIPYGPRGGLRPSETWTCRVDPEGGLHYEAEGRPAEVVPRGCTLKQARSIAGAVDRVLDGGASARLSQHERGLAWAWARSIP